jgi:demethylmenaquinone methyltransferase / 2-methoxy-6-polyprenyl-1,4-benzoquinol methylase
MFGAISRRYDLANHTLSCGCDFVWRKRAAAIVTKWKPAKIADLATGTGDLALAIQRVLPNAEVIGLDFSEEMLAVARTKGLQQTIAGDVLALPFRDRAFDCITIAFGLRNVSDWGAALREMARVLTLNGHLLVLEFSLPQSALLCAAYRFYLHRLVPLIGSFLTQKKSAYDYLGDSIEKFPGDAALTDLINASGFRDAVAQPLTGGIVTIYTATKR